MKSHEKVPLMVLTNVYKDYVRLCCVEQDVRDLRRLADRFENEGLAFFSLALPRFGAGIESGLERGYLDAADFPGFSTGRQGIPRLFGVFTRLVFDEQGILLDKPAPLAIAALRQLAYTYKKLKELCREDKIITAYKKFIEVEAELAGFRIHSADWTNYISLCNVLWGSAISQIEVWSTTPKHGPGATADKRINNKKYVWHKWHDRLENYFPLLRNCYPESAYGTEYFDRIESIKPEDEQPVKVIAVPKTAKTPRIIAIEPTCMQYVQQGLARELIRVLENGKLTKGHINFKDQSVNQRLALHGSIDGGLATIDLSDASDRVLLSIVEPMFRSNPELWGAILACRSMRAQIETTGQIIPLQKFASMGSALCFPIESMVFYTLCILGQLRDRKMEITHANVSTLARGTYVYGDDIVIPARTTQAVFDTLQSFGCKVNTHKSFYRGLFRESCGCDYYAGQDVTPVYVRQHSPKSRKKVTQVLSAVATMNQFYKIGLWQTAQYMRNSIESVIGELPVLPENTEGIGFESFLAKPSLNTVEDERLYISRFRTARWNKQNQHFEIKGLVVSPITKGDRIDSYPALMRFFLEPSEDIYRRFVRNHKTGKIVSHDSGRDLERSSRRGAVTLKYRWYRPY